MTNPGYVLDPERAVLERIANDPSQFIFDVTQELAGCRQGAFVIAAAEILAPPRSTPVERSLEAAYKSSAFIAGAATILAAFTESDLESSVRDNVQKRFALQAVPIELLAPDNTGCRMAFELEARKGIAAHPEVKDHIDYINQYFIETTRQTLYASYSFIGSGFASRRLDICYNALLDMNTSQWFGVSDLSTINWDELLLPE